MAMFRSSHALVIEGAPPPHTESASSSELADRRHNHCLAADEEEWPLAEPRQQVGSRRQDQSAPTSMSTCMDGQGKPDCTGESPARGEDHSGSTSPGVPSSSSSSASWTEESIVEQIEAKQLMLKGWHSMPLVPSLEEVHSTVKVPPPSAPWYIKLFAFSGLGFVISVGYMDPGNWGTDIAGGSTYGYALLFVILFSSCLAMFLQSLALKLGVVAERDLAQACHDAYPKPAAVFLWITAEIAIAATDLAEVIGSAIALNLLFGLPVWIGVLVTAADVLIIIFLGMKNMRVLEVFICLLCALIAGCMVYELVVADPGWGDVFKGFIPTGRVLTDPDMLYAALGILGATVMPHNLYLHSSIIQTRNYARTKSGKKMAVKYGSVDSSLSLSVAFFVNAAILILAASAFYYGPYAGEDVADINDAYLLISPALGQEAAKILFGVALLASGQNATITGTLAGQIVMEGFVRFKIPPWSRRMITRLVAITPAVIVAALGGTEGTGKLLVLSQVILSVQLPFAVGPLVHFTCSRAKMGPYVNGWVATVLAVAAFLVITGLNAYLVIQFIVGGANLGR